MYTKLDRFINKIKRQGFFLFSSLVVVLMAYGIYSMGNLPQLPERVPKKKKKAKKGTKDQHPVDEMSRKQLYEFLTRNSVIVSVDVSTEEVRTTAKSVYDGLNLQGTGEQV